MTAINEQDKCCEECGCILDACECEPLRDLIDEVADVLDQLDRLAEIWGDEGVFRRCRDGLRRAVAKAERKVEG